MADISSGSAQLLATVIGDAFALAAASSGRGTSDGFDAWWWIERASWLVTILGIPGLILALSVLWKRADVVVGFAPGRRTGVIRKKQVLGHRIRVQQNSRPLVVDTNVAIANNGRATARDIVVNFTFPSGLQLNQVRVPTGKLFSRSDDGRVVWVWTDDYLHPGDAIESGLSIRVPEDTDRQVILADVSMANSARVTRALVINVERLVSEA